MIYFVRLSIIFKKHVNAKILVSSLYKILNNSIFLIMQCSKQAKIKELFYV